MEYVASLKQQGLSVGSLETRESQITKALCSFMSLQEKLGSETIFPTHPTDT